MNEAGDAPNEATDPHLLAPGTLPTPFTADEIRAGCLDGRVIRMRLEADGRVVGFRTNTYRDGDVEGATIESQAFDTPLGRLDCLAHRHQEPDGAVSEFWFARSAPGMPVRFRTTRDGLVVREVVVIEDVADRG